MRKKSNGKPSVQLSKVPPLRDICEKLGFRMAKEASAFTDFAHKWRKSYTTVENRPGTDLVEWNLRKTQDDLFAMSKTFLYKDGNGKKFWPSLDNPRDKLCFPNDEDKLIALLKQLFWKQNRYAANNQHYAKDNKERDKFRNTFNHQSLDKPSPETTSRNTSKRPSQPTSYVSPYTAIERDERSLKRQKVSDAEYSERLTNDFEPSRRVSDRKRIPRGMIGTVSSAQVDKVISDDPNTAVIGGDTPTSQARKKNPTDAPNELNATVMVGGERAQSLNYVTHPLQRQSPPALSSLPTPPVVSNYMSPAVSNPIPSSLSPPADLSSPAASTTPLESRLQHSPPSNHSPPPTEPLCAPIAPLAKANFQIVFHIIQHLRGITHQTMWVAGRFGNKTVDEFLIDIAEELKCRAESITMIKLVLKIESKEINAKVPVGEAGTWELMKATFRDGIRSVMENGVGMGIVNVMIEPVMKDSSGLQFRKKVEDDDIDM